MEARLAYPATGCRQEGPPVPCEHVPRHALPAGYPRGLVLSLSLWDCWLVATWALWGTDEPPSARRRCRIISAKHLNPLIGPAPRGVLREVAEGVTMEDRRRPAESRPRRFCRKLRDRAGALRSGGGGGGGSCCRPQKVRGLVQHEHPK